MEEGLSCRSTHLKQVYTNFIDHEGKKRLNAYCITIFKDHKKKQNFSKAKSTPRKVMNETITPKTKVLQVWKKRIKMSSGRKYLIL